MSSKCTRHLPASNDARARAHWCDVTHDTCHDDYAVQHSSQSAEPEPRLDMSLTQNAA